MLEVKIIIEATELANAINNLAAAMGGAKHPISAQTAVPAAQTTAPRSASQAAPAGRGPPYGRPAPWPCARRGDSAPAPASAAPMNYPAPGVPLAQPPKYTVDQIMAAGAMLMDAGKVNELMNLLHSFGVQAVMDLKPEQLGAFATALRELGAKI